LNTPLETRLSAYKGPHWYVLKKWLKLDHTGFNLVVFALVLGIQMHEAEVYVEGVKYSFIGLAVEISSAIVVDGVLYLRILSGSRLKGLKSGF